MTQQSTTTLVKPEKSTRGVRLSLRSIVVEATTVEIVNIIDYSPLRPQDKRCAHALWLQSNTAVPDMSSWRTSVEALA